MGWDCIKDLAVVIDFTYSQYISLITALLKQGYEFQTYSDFLISSRDKVVILRHDVDCNPSNSLKMAEIEKRLNIKASYYFRIVPSVFQPGIIKAISQLGHEIGYHYEDISLFYDKQKAKVTSKENANDCEKYIVQKAIEGFEFNLKKLRQIVPIETICMHGSPMSKWDNRLLWKYYNFKDYGVVGEPYITSDFDKIFYITDTGRKWNKASISVRDKVKSSFNIPVKSTQSLIDLLESNSLPLQMMINIHPHRWHHFGFNWFKEIFIQNLKNLVKAVIVSK